MKTWSALLFVLLGSPTVSATTPARWIEELATCQSAERDVAIAGLRALLTEKEAGKIASKIVAQCKSRIPRELFSSAERADMNGADRFELKKALLAAARRNAQ